MSNLLVKFSRSLKGDVYNDLNQCFYCGGCVKKCKVNALIVNSQTKEWIWETDKCLRCGHCVKDCPAKSLTLKK